MSIIQLLRLSRDRGDRDRGRDRRDRDRDRDRDHHKSSRDHRRDRDSHREGRDSYRESRDRYDGARPSTSAGGSGQKSNYFESTDHLEQDDSHSGGLSNKDRD